MSTPEWMKKYEQIGQKGSEEVTATTDSGDPVTSPVPTKRTSVAGQPGGDKPAGGGFLFGKGKAGESDSDDAAAAFASAGGGGGGAQSDDDAAAMFASAGGGGGGAQSDDDDAAALFASAGGGGGGAQSDDDDAAAMFASAGGGGGAAAATSDDDDAAAMFASAGGGGDGGGAQSDDDAAAMFASAGTTETQAEEEVAVEEEVVVEDEAAAPAGAEEEIINEDGEVIDEDGNVVEDEVIEDEEVILEEDENGNIIEDDGEEVILEEDENGNIIEDDDEEEEVVETTRELQLDPEEEKKPEDDFDPLDIEAQRQILHKTRKQDRSMMSVMAPICICITIFVVAIVLAYEVFGIEIEDESPVVSPTEAPGIAAVPLAPTNIGLTDNARTTELDPVQGNCNFGTLTMPHVIDQCACGITINTIAPDVLTRYEKLIPWVTNLFGSWAESASSCSPQNQALVWLSSGTNNGGETTLARLRDRYVAAYFYIEQMGEQWQENDMWLSENSVCSWKRVFCDDNQAIVAIDMQSNNLGGGLSDASTMFASLESLTVRGNGLIGTLPAELFTSSTLKSLDLYDNSLFGDIPAFGQNIPLETLHMGSNNLSGNLNANIQNAKSLKKLDLSTNTLNGELPPPMFSLPLQEFSIHSNLFTGTIPSSIGNAVDLIKLDLGGTNIEGTLPSEMRALTNLEEVTIRNAPTITGGIPDSFGLNWKKMVKFTITETGMDGNIPWSFGQMTDLEIIDFSKNFFRGDLPPELGELENLEKLHLYDNAISGTIPPHIGNMTALEELLLENNKIEGDIPSQLGYLENLQTFTLQGNNMGGRAPDEVCELRGESLNVFVVDCPERDDFDNVLGLICKVPSCCTDCE